MLLILSFLLLSPLWAAPVLGCELPTNERGVPVSSNGVVDLKWKDQGADRFELQQAGPDSSENFVARYVGPDVSSVRSGMAAGTHRFRVRAIDSSAESSAWSNTLEIEVVYMDAGKVRLLLILGGLVVLATALAITHGHLTHRRKGGVA